PFRTSRPRRRCKADRAHDRVGIAREWFPRRGRELGCPMRPASSPRQSPGDAKLLRVDPARKKLSHRHAIELPELLDPGDIVVVNDAATLPASLHVRGTSLELRLVRRLDDDSRWTAIVFGGGDWRTPTERRPEPPVMTPGEKLELADDLSA